MTTISAKSILASRHAETGHTLHTLLLRYPRWIHAEARTHRLMKIGEGMEISLPTPSLMEDENLSRNAASSRAIPVTKLIDDILADPAMPIHWGKAQKGMQAFEELDHSARETCRFAWERAMRNAIREAREMLDCGAHKQLVNRILEPFSHITVVVSGTQWTNFLALRDHPDAEPHIQMLAREIRQALEGADVQELRPGEWHLPFVSPNERTNLDDAIKLSVARCASTSFRTVDGFDMTLDRAVEIYEKLRSSKPIHASPFEHVALADDRIADEWVTPVSHGNFTGFRQLRKTLPNECA